MARDQPQGRVPALTGVPGRIGGAENLLTELHAILVYLARAHPAAGLLPADLAAEARCVEWMNWLASKSGAPSGLWPKKKTFQRSRPRGAKT